MVTNEYATKHDALNGERQYVKYKQYSLKYTGASARTDQELHCSLTRECTSEMYYGDRYNS